VGVPSPAIPSFTDGVVVHQAELNALASNLTNLYTYNQAGFTTQRPCVIVNQTSGQVISNNTDTVVTFGSAGVNTDNMWTGSVPDRLTIQHAGIYWLFGQARWPSIAGASLSNGLAAYLLINGTSTTNAIGSGALPMLNVGNISEQVGCLANLAAGATVYLSVWQNSGANQTLQTDRGGSFLGAIFMTPST